MIPRDRRRIPGTLHFKKGILEAQEVRQGRQHLIHADSKDVFLLGPAAVDHLGQEQSAAKLDL
jgi:hypothetical protein